MLKLFQGNKSTENRIKTPPSISLEGFPTFVMHHKETGNSMRWISMAHIARPEFYIRVNEIIKSEKNAIVLTEGVKNSRTMISKIILQTPRDLVCSIIGIISKLFPNISLQKRGLNVPEKININADLHVDEIVNATSVPRIVILTSLAIATILYNHQSPPDYYSINNQIMEGLLAYMLFFKQGVVHLRNQNLIAKINEHIQQSNLIVSWGVFHQKWVIKKLLETNQWELQENTIEHIPVLDIESVKHEFNLLKKNDGNFLI